MPAGEIMRNFITIEGCEGVGKTYQTRMLKQYCEENGFNVVFTREPGGSDIAEQIRRILLDANNSAMDDMCEAFLYAASRIQHLKDIVKPALQQGKVFATSAIYACTSARCAEVVIFGTSSCSGASTT